jgi:UTP--glucose-1-phosphate uridylyltransferase
MKAIIPAAGHGTRFLPVTRVIPKEMLPIGSKPALELIVEEAKSAGADEIVMVISPGKELIREYFKGDPSISFVYQYEQRGLGHAVLQAADSVKAEDESVLILLGDALVAGCNASQLMVAQSKENGGACVIGLERVPAEKTSRYGIVKIEDGRIVDMVEKPASQDAPSDLAVAGRYLLDVKIFAYLRDQTAGVGGEIQLTDAIRRMLAEKKVVGCVYPGKRQDIGNPQGYLKALESMNENR